MADPSDLPLYLPFDSDAADRDQLILGGERPPISFLGLAFTREEFSAYVDSLAFGDNPPLWMVLHHTAIPATSWAPYGEPARFWDAGEANMAVAKKKTKRLKQLKNIFDYYERDYGWLAGPQLWADDLWIYVGSPLTAEGVHAGGGNYLYVDGRRRYSLGLEVIGHYERKAWPEAVMRNVAHAVAVLQRKLGTFQLISGKGPGFVSEHRHYFKPECPGAAVRPAAYLPRFTQALEALTPAATRLYRVLRRTAVREKATLDGPVAWRGTAWLPAGQELELAASRFPGWLHWEPGGYVLAADVAPVEQLTMGLSADSPIIGQPFAPDEEVIAAFARICAGKGSPYSAETARPIETVIGPRYAELCKESGVRLILVLAQVAVETDWLRAALAQRQDKEGRDLRNPAGIGVYEGRDKATPYYRVGTVWDSDVGGYRPATQFKDWKRESCVAHVGRLVAYATKPKERTPEQQRLVDSAMAFRGLPRDCHGSAPTLRELGSGPNTVPGCGWAGAGDAGGLGYGANLAAAGNAILAEVARA